MPWQNSLKYSFRLGECLVHVLLAFIYYSRFTTKGVLQMSSCYPYCPTKEVVDPPVQMINDYYHPQVVNVIHPIEVINQHHCVPVPNHIYAVTVKDQMCTVSSRKGSKRKRKK